MPATGKRILYIEDLARLKTATLESEPVFFERLEKQSKIEATRLLASDAIQSLGRIRLHLSLLADLLEQTNQELGRLYEPLEATGLNIAAAQTELRLFHQSATPEAAAIAAGRSNAAPLLARVRRLIQAAERQLRTTSFNLTEGQRRLEDALMPITGALEDMTPDDPRRDTFEQAVQALEVARTSLSQAMDQANALNNHLVTIRRTFFPECSTPSGEPLQMPAQPTDAQSLQVQLQAECQQNSLTLLNGSAAAIGMLEEAMTALSQLLETLDRGREARERAINEIERGEMASNPALAKIRHLQSRARELLERADEQLTGMKRILTEDMPGETRHCPDCGKIVMQTRKVPDPSCACVRANAAMLDTEQTLREARELAEQMSQLLDEVEMPTNQLGGAERMARARRELSGDKGVIDQLALALERGQEFRNQEFDFYPGEAFPPAIEPAPLRAFEPMFATYVARQSWHYPLYFEDLSLERYGHSFGCVQPAVSYGKFLVDLAMVPYNVWLDPPCEVQYTHGLYRPGDCVPHLIYLPRPDVCAALFQAAVWTGLLYMP